MFKGSPHEKECPPRIPVLDFRYGLRITSWLNKQVMGDKKKKRRRNFSQDPCQWQVGRI